MVMRWPLGQRAAVNRMKVWNVYPQRAHASDQPPEGGRGCCGM